MGRPEKHQMGRKSLKVGSKNSAFTDMLPVIFTEKNAEILLSFTELDLRQW